MPRGSSPISSRKRVPPLASSNRPFLWRSAPVKAPALVAEQLGLQQVLGQGRAVDGHQRPPPGDVAEVDRLGHQLLARPRLARHQHVARRRRHPRHPIEDVQHPRASPEQVMVGVLLPQTAPQVGHLVDQPTILQRLVDHDFQADRIDRLEDQVVNTELHRLDRRLDRGISGHRDDRHRHLPLPDLPDQLQPADARQAQVRQYQANNGSRPATPGPSCRPGRP